MPLPDLLAALLFHFLCGAGTASEHLFQLLGRRLCESGIAERRSVLPWALWERFLRDALRATAHRRRHPEAFYRGWRLVAIDGTQFSVSNTPQTAKQLAKASSRRAQAAFAKITAGVLLEVGLHNPLAAAIGHSGQSEWLLSLQLLAQLAKGCLRLADRLSGCAAFAAQALDRCQKVSSHGVAFGAAETFTKLSTQSTPTGGQGATVVEDGIVGRSADVFNPPWASVKTRKELSLAEPVNWTPCGPGKILRELCGSPVLPESVPESERRGGGTEARSSARQANSRD